MSLSAMSGPLVVNSPIGDQDQGPTIMHGGAMLLDPRVGYQGGGAAGSPPILGWGGNDYLTLWQAPSQLAVANIAASQTNTSGNPLTLVTSSGAGITVGVLVNGVSCLAIDGAATPIKYGYTGAVQCYDPRNLVARNVRITTGGAEAAGATMTVRGFDIYNQPMSETIAINGAGTPFSGKKAFKYIRSITSGGTISGGNFSVGTGDVFGFPLYSAQFPEVAIGWAGAIVTSSTGFVAGDTTSPATATTGDVRGTYAPQSSPSDGTKTLMFQQIVYPWSLLPVAGQPASTAYTGLFGVAQFTN